MGTKIEFSDEELELLKDENLDEKLDLCRKILDIYTFGYHRFENELDACLYNYHVAELKYKIALIRQLIAKLYRDEKENK